MKFENGSRSEIREGTRERLLEFATRVIRLTQYLGKSYAHQHISNQLLRSGTAPLACHAEAQAAESNADFIHKLKLALKELRETHCWLELIKRNPLIDNPSKLDSLLDEVDQLERIFNASIQTVKAKKSPRL